MWLIILSDQLPVVALVSRYLTNKLIGREPLPWCDPKATFSKSHATKAKYAVLPGR